MTPNQVTVARVLMAFAAVALYWRADAIGLALLPASCAALGLIVAAIAFDGLDGWLARRKGLATPLGAQLDILGDRVVENLFFTFFAVNGLVSLWVPVIFFVRGLMTDFLRGLAERRPALERDLGTFRRNWMLERAWGRAIVASRASRAAYGTLKCVCFCALSVELTVCRLMIGSFSTWRIAAAIVAEILTGATLAFCLLRAVPVLWEGRGTLAALASAPREARKLGAPGASVAGAKS